MLQNAYLLAKIGADTAENERTFAENLPQTGNYPTGPSLSLSRRPSRRPWHAGPAGAVTGRLVRACVADFLIVQRSEENPAEDDEEARIAADRGRGTYVKIKSKKLNSKLSLDSKIKSKMKYISSIT